MSDIITWIRDCVHDVPMDTEPLLDSTADEIERLRAANRIPLSLMPLMQNADGVLWVEMAALEGLLDGLR